MIAFKKVAHLIRSIDLEHKNNDSSYSVFEEMMASLGEIKDSQYEAVHKLQEIIAILKKDPDLQYHHDNKKNLTEE